MDLSDPADAESVLAGLDPEQVEAARAVRGPVCILAGAGTGKTRTITHRIAYAVRTGAVPPGQLLAVTFTARAAGEMRTRLRALGVGPGSGGPGVQALTFHAAALRQLRYFGPRVLGGPVPDLLDNKIRLVSTAAARAGVRETDRTVLRDLAAEIEWAKVTLCPAERYAARAAEAGREPPLPAATMVAVMAAYEEVKARSGVLDFEDLLLVTAAAIEEHRAVAEELRSRYRHFVVDEYQDVSPLQQRLLDAWLGGRDDLCVVGDPNQTIYSFTGATPSYLLSFPGRHPGATVVRLTRDYRSTPQVVELANRVLGRRSALRLVGQRPSGPRPTFAEYDDEPAEAAAVAAACRARTDSGTPASELAVLYRVNAQSQAYEQALAEAGVPYVLRGGERFFDRAEIKQALLLLAGGRPVGRGRHQAGRHGAGRAVRAELVAVRAARRRVGPGAVGVAGRAGRAGRGAGRAAAGRRARGLPGRAGAAGRGPARADRAGGSRWPRCTRPRGWSGTRCSWSGWSRGRCRSSTRSPTSRSTRSGGCSTSA